MGFNSFTIKKKRLDNNLTKFLYSCQDFLLMIHITFFSFYLFIYFLSVTKDIYERRDDYKTTITARRTTLKVLPV